jgi:hypothetical protein
LFFIREIARLKKKKYEKNITSSSYIVNKDTSNENININQDHKDKALSEEEQWDINNKLLSESYEEEEKLVNEMLAEEENYDATEEYSDFINSLDEVGLHNLENAMEAMEVESGKRKRSEYGSTSIKEEGPKERPTRSAGNWPPEKEDFQPTYIPGQYRHMGSKRRDFEKPVQFQNTKYDGAILNLAAHDPIDWPNILSIWKALIVQKYIQNQHNSKQLSFPLICSKTTLYPFPVMISSNRTHLLVELFLLFI